MQPIPKGSWSDWLTVVWASVAYKDWCTVGFSLCLDSELVPNRFWFLCLDCCFVEIFCINYLKVWGFGNSWSKLLIRLTLVCAFALRWHLVRFSFWSNYPNANWDITFTDKLLMKQLSYQTNKQVLVNGCPKMPLFIYLWFLTMKFQNSILNKITFMKSSTQVTGVSY